MGKLWTGCVHRPLRGPALFLGVLLVSAVATAQPAVRATAFLENPGAPGVPEAAGLWRHAEDPDLSRILVAEGFNGLIHYGLDGSDPLPLVSGQEVRGVAIAQRGGGLAEGHALIATLAPGTSSLLLFLLRFDEEGAPEVVASFTHFAEARPRPMSTAASLAFGEGPTGALYLFVSFPSWVEQFEVVLDEAEEVWSLEALLVAERNLVGSPALLAVGPTGTQVYAAVQESGVLGGPVAPGDQTWFTPIFSSVDVAPPVNGLTLDRDAPVHAPTYMLVSNGIDQTVRIFAPLAEVPAFVGGFRVLPETSQIPVAVAGLMLTTQPVGELFPEGLLVVASGVTGDRRGALVSWGEVARAFDPPLFFTDEEPEDGPDGGTDAGTDAGTDGGQTQAPLPGGPGGELPLQPGDSGCGCTGAGPMSSVAALLGLGLLAARRQRR